MAQTARIPIAEHGLHTHKINYPYLGTFSFMDIVPVFSMPLEKGEKCSITGGALSRLNPITNPAFATGRYNFKAFFVPFKYVFRPWYYMKTQTSYTQVSGQSSTLTKGPYTTMQLLSQAIKDLSVPYGTNPTADSLFIYYPVSNVPQNYDILMSNGGVNDCYMVAQPRGAQILKILGSLGITPTWDLQDSTPVNLLAPLCYLRVFADYYFPSQYVTSSVYQLIVSSILKETSYYSLTTLTAVIRALIYCVSGYYDNSLFDNAFDNPVGPNSGVGNGNITIHDPTLTYPANSNTTSTATRILDQGVDNTSSANGTPSLVQTSYFPSSGQTIATRNTPIITQFVLDSLQSLNNFVQRNRIAGGRLLDRWLSKKGEKLQHDTTEMSYYLGQKNIEIDVEAVENNSDVNLGELAGKGVASTRDTGPLSFNCNAVDDGLFMVVAYAKADCDLPVYNDPWNFYVDWNDFRQPEFDKLGPESIRCASVFTSFLGGENYALKDTPFAFWSRYCGNVAERTRLVGDFRLNTRGAGTLKSFYTFRDITNYVSSTLSLGHSLTFLDSRVDAGQFKRLFYTAKSDDMQLFIRWKVNGKFFKLPLGDSYDWDDDEYNKRVSILVSGQRS